MEAVLQGQYARVTRRDILDEEEAASIEEIAVEGAGRYIWDGLLSCACMRRASVRRTSPRKVIKSIVLDYLQASRGRRLGRAELTSDGPRLPGSLGHRTSLETQTMILHVATRSLYTGGWETRCAMARKEAQVQAPDMCRSQVG